MSTTLRRLAGLALLTGCALGVAACSSNYGGDFVPAKKSNLSIRGFSSFTSTGTTGGTGGTGSTGGSASGANGGTSGPIGGNVTRFQYVFDPFPNGATLLLNRSVGASIPDVSSDNRQRVVNVEVTFRGTDVNNNPITIVSYLPTTGQPDPSNLGTAGGGGTGTTQSGQQISTLRPSAATVTDQGSAAGIVLEYYPLVQAEFTITNGITVRMNRLTLRYFEPDGTLAPISSYDNPINFVMEANPIASGFTSAGGGGA